MKTEMKQIRFQNARGSFAELQRFHSMAVRGIEFQRLTGLIDGCQHPKAKRSDELQADLAGMVNSLGRSAAGQKREDGHGCNRDDG